jgi:hypothetical protein
MSFFTGSLETFLSSYNLCGAKKIVSKRHGAEEKIHDIGCLFFNMRNTRNCKSL